MENWLMLTLVGPELLPKSARLYLIWVETLGKHRWPALAVTLPSCSWSAFRKRNPLCRKSSNLYVMSWNCFRA